MVILSFQAFCPVEKAGGEYAALTRGLCSCYFLSFPSGINFHKFCRDILLTPAEFRASGLGGGDSLGLPFSNILPFILRYKRQHLKQESRNKRAQQVFCCARIEKWHI